MCKNSFVDFTSKKGFVLAKIVQKTHRQKKIKQKIESRAKSRKTQTNRKIMHCFALFGRHDTIQIHLRAEPFWCQPKLV